MFSPGSPIGTAVMASTTLDDSVGNMTDNELTVLLTLVVILIAALLLCLKNLK